MPEENIDSSIQMGYKGYNPSLGGEVKDFEELVDPVTATLFKFCVI